jgi:hypothetical protein
MKHYINNVLTDCGPSRTTLHSGTLPGTSKQRAKARVTGARNPEGPRTETFPCVNKCQRQVSTPGTECWRCEWVRLRSLHEIVERENKLRIAAERQRATLARNVMREHANAHLAKLRESCVALEEELRAVDVDLGSHLEHVIHLSPHPRWSLGFYADWNGYLQRLLARETAWHIEVVAA